MIVRDNLNSAVLEKQHYKMYKSGKSWIVAGIAALALGGSMVATGTAHADEVSSVQSAAPQQQTSSGNAVTSTSSSMVQATNTSGVTNPSISPLTSSASNQSTQSVSLDHSALDQATSNAGQAGVSVRQTPTITKVVPEGQKDQAVKEAESDYVQQAQTINKQVAEYNQQKANQSKYNGTRGDTTKLDEAVKEAQNTPGITVIQDKDQISTVSPTNESVNAFTNHATVNNDQQAKAIQDAIATQKQNNQEYQQELDKAVKDNVTHWTYHIDNGYFVDLTADADITWHYDVSQDSVIVTGLKLNLTRKDPKNRGGGFWDTFIFTRPQAPLPTEDGTFLGANGDLNYIKNAHDVWDKILSGRDDVYAYFSQNNKTEENSIVYNLQNFKPYNAQRNSDGSWTLLSVFDRWNWHLNGENSDPLGVRWGKDSVAATLKGIPPVRKTTEVHYHYNTAAVQAPSHADATYHLYNLQVPNVQPTKSETDDSGVDINGKQLMDGDRVNFGLGWVLTPYKDIDANSDSIHKGFQYIDDYQDDALVPDISSATIIDTVTGKAVTGVTLTKWSSLDSAPQTIKDIVAKAGVHPTGAFLLWSANDPESFYKNYVVAGHDLKINLPMTVKANFSGKLKNQAVQVDFGTGHSTNEVGNEVPKLNPHKDIVINIGSKQSLNNQTISIGQVADYELDSSIRPANYGGQTNEWSLTDHIDTVHDQLTGNNKVFAKTAMTLNGHQYNVGDDISSYFDIKQQDGTVTFTVKPEFLAEIKKDTNKKVPIQWAGYIQFKRIAAGDVKNTFEESYNHQIVKSNTVVTHTKTPKPAPTPKSEILSTPNNKTPKVVVAATSVPMPSHTKAQKLPQTGNSSQTSVALLGFAGILLSLGALGTKKKVHV